MGNTTNKNYGYLSVSRDQGIETKNRRVTVTDIAKFRNCCRKRRCLLLSKVAQEQIKHQAHEYRKVYSHVD